MGNLYGAARRLYVRNTSEYDAQRVALGLMIGDMLCGRIRILDYTNADIVNWIKKEHIYKLRMNKRITLEYKWNIPALGMRKRFYIATT